MSKLNNAPLVEVIFQIKWGKTTAKDNELLIEFSQEEQALMPGKFQVHAEAEGFSFSEVLDNQPPLPHLVRYRYRQKQESYPLFQLGNGVFTINQSDSEEYGYDWDVFKPNLEKGIYLFEKCYPFPIENLPLIDIQLRYRDAIIAETDENFVSFISNKLNVGKLQIPTVMADDPNIDTSSPLGSLTLQVGCNKPKGQIICQINRGISDGKKAFILDFIIVSQFNTFSTISSEKLIDWCSEARLHHKVVFEAIIDKNLMETFR